MGVLKVFFFGIRVRHLLVLQFDVIGNTQRIHQWLDGFFLHIHEVVVTAILAAIGRLAGT
jgi:hypothetical protein